MDRTAAQHTNRPETEPVTASLQRFWQTAMECRECPTLAPWRKFPPAARGNPSRHLMIIGEAPGRVSLDHGRPFSNPRNLMIREAFAQAIAPQHHEPEEFCYFSDTVKCWPATPSGANRSPTARETQTCVSRHLLREIELIAPAVIFAFGVRAASAVMGHPIKIAAVHGTTLIHPAGYRVIPLMHPSTINIAGMRRVGIQTLADYANQLAMLFRRELTAC